MLWLEKENNETVMHAAVRNNVHVLCTICCATYKAIIAQVLVESPYARNTYFDIMM
jgi:hypothetical protein